MMRRSVACGFLILSLVFLAAPRQAAAQDARAFVSTLGAQAIQVLGPGVPYNQRLARFRELFRANFDLPVIGQFVLGRYWRTATPEEQQEFLQLFLEYIARAYAARLGEYGGEPFNVTGAQSNGQEILVSSEIIRPNGNLIKVQWVLIAQDGHHKIIDVFVGEFSMRGTLRDEFAAVIQRNGGRVQGLLAQLRQKLSAG